ncbi:hypothetical protein AVEN_242611-1, partial [Araneus ventricosus]
HVLLACRVHSGEVRGYHCTTDLRKLFGYRSRACIHSGYCIVCLKNRFAASEDRNQSFIADLIPKLCFSDSVRSKTWKFVKISS